VIIAMEGEPVEAVFYHLAGDKSFFVWPDKSAACADFRDLAEIPRLQTGHSVWPVLKSYFTRFFSKNH